MSAEHDHATNEHLFLLEPQSVTLPPIRQEGWILDVGGGGEGIIGQLEGSRVVAIDLRANELAEAAAGPLKIVMDARDLKFLDETFGAATAFFSLMYLKSRDDLCQVMQEVRRVLRPGAVFYIWDVAVTERLDPIKEYYAVPVRAIVGKREIHTGYGQKWPPDRRDLAYYETAARAAGFQVLASSCQGNGITLQLLKAQVARPAE